MWVLPAEIEPSGKRLIPVHKPRLRLRYSSDRFKECLRQDSGYLCALCLIAEADVLLHALVERNRWGIFTVEHIKPRHGYPKLIHEYANCVWACRLCNRSRGTTEHRNLRTPNRTAWGDLFIAKNGELLPRDTRQAAFTSDTYKLNDASRVKMRQNRLKKLSDLYRSHDELVTEITKLNHRIASLTAPHRHKVSEMIRKLTALLAVCVQDLKQFPAAPQTRDRCGCDGEPPKTDLPEWLLRQCRWID